MNKYTLLTCCLFVGFSLAASAARADLELEYSVNIVQAGPVDVGSVIDWQLFVQVMDSTAQNFGLAQVSVSLQDSEGEVMTPGALGNDFNNYAFGRSGGLPAGAMGLNNIAATMLNENSGPVGADGNLGPFLLASGSYMVTQAGLHTLMPFIMSPPDASSRFYTADGQGFGGSTAFGPTQITFVSDTIQVNQLNQVPEPASLAMMGLAACGALVVHRRRRMQSGRGDG